MGNCDLKACTLPHTGVERRTNNPASRGSACTTEKPNITETEDVGLNVINGPNLATSQILTEGVPNEEFLGAEDDTVTSAGQSLRDASTSMRLMVHPKTKVRIGCWNVRTMYQLGKTAQVCREMVNYRLDLLGISECRWTGMGKLQTQTGQVIIYSGKEDRHEYGVALVMSKEAAKSLISWKP